MLETHQAGGRRPLHEYIKVELEIYATQNDAKLVKPFMLVVAQDTDHAGAIR